MSTPPPCFVPDLIAIAQRIHPACPFTGDDWRAELIEWVRAETGKWRLGPEQVSRVSVYVANLVRHGEQQ